MRPHTDRQFFPGDGDLAAQFRGEGAALDPHAPHHSEGGVATANPAESSTVAAFLAGRVLRDGEAILLILRPSRWFIALTSLRFLAIVGILMLLGILLEPRLGISARRLVELAIFVSAGRLMWAVVQWMGLLYILTDQRIVRIAGVFQIDVFDCPLRKVARTLLEFTFKERLCRVGSILIIPQDEQCPLGQWQMVPRPHLVHQQIVSTINRARQGGWVWKMES